MYHLYELKIADVVLIDVPAGSVEVGLIYT